MRAPRHRRGVRTTQRAGAHGPTFAVMRKLLCLALFAASPALACITITQQPRRSLAVDAWSYALNVGRWEPDTVTTRVEASAPSPISYQWYQGRSGDVSRPIYGATSPQFCPPATGGRHCSWGSSGSLAVWVRLEADCGTADSETSTMTRIQFLPRGVMILSGKGPAEGWRIAGAADLNADGHVDLLLHNPASGELVIWARVEHAVVSTEDSLDRRAIPPWWPAAIADIDRDSDPDLILHNPDTRQIAVWTLDGLHVVSTEGFIGFASPGWTVRAAADFNRDGHADLVLVNELTRESSIWTLEGLTVKTETLLPPASEFQKFAGAGDFDDDGWVDLLWESSSIVEMWRMNGVTLRSRDFRTSAFWYQPTLAIADLNGDKRPDVVGAAGQTVVNLKWWWPRALRDE